MFTVKSVKVCAVVEQVIEGRCSLDELQEHLRANRFRGNVQVNFSQGGITNVTTRESIPITMQQLDSLLPKP